MIFSSDVLFLHVPKTAGISISHYLLRVLPKPIYYSHPPQDEQVSDTGIVQIAGIRHETLAEARSMVRQYGFDISRFKLILAVLRNPYAIELSRYKYFQHAPPIAQARDRELALNEDLTGFALKSSYHGGEQRPLESYFILDGKIPPNLRIIRFERLVIDLQEALSQVGITQPVDLDHENKSERADFQLYYTRDAEAAVYHKYKWVFDAGWYERFSPGDESCYTALKQELGDLKRDLERQWQEASRLQAECQAVSQWAQQLEATAHEQQRQLGRYQLALRPILLPLRLWSRLSSRLSATRPVGRDA